MGTNKVLFIISESEFVRCADNTLLYQMLHRDLKQLDDCVEAAHTSALNWFSSIKIVCNRDETQQFLLSLSDNKLK